MGQYWIPVNLDKKEFVSPHKLGAGMKLWEQLANHPGTGAALIILTAAMPERRGGGDFDLTENWHGPERVDMSWAGPMPEDYPTIAGMTIGRWAGDRIALIGDYAESDDLLDDDARLIYRLCDDPNDFIDYPEDYPEDTKEEDFYTDISDYVCAVIEHELRGKYSGGGWREFEYNNK